MSGRAPRTRGAPPSPRLLPKTQAGPQRRGRSSDNRDQRAFLVWRETVVSWRGSFCCRFACELIYGEGESVGSREGVGSAVGFKQK